MKKNENGYVFLITILTLVLISIIGIGVVTVSSNTLKTSTNERSSQSLFYLAEAGLNYKEAILLEKINEIYATEKGKDSNKTGTTEVFNNSFNTQLNTLIFHHKEQILNEQYFKNVSNGIPNVKVTVTQNGSPRKFTILSEATLIGQSGKRTVKRDYEIPTNLLEITTAEITIPPNSNGSNTSEPNIVETLPAIDYRNTVANIHTKDVYFLAVINNNMNARFNVGFSSWERLFKITGASVREKFSYNKSLPNKPTDPLVFQNAPEVAINPSKEVDPSVSYLEMTEDYKMKKLPNFSNKVLNIHVPSGEHDLVFTGGLLDYNLSSLRFNVTGNGTLNIVFNRKFQLNSNRKFIINAPNTKVNLILKEGATIFGEMNAQDMYVNGHLETITVQWLLGQPKPRGILIANNVYITKGDFHKELHSQVKINNLISLEGDLKVASPSFKEYPFYAQNITLKKGNLKLEAGATLNINNNLYVENGQINSLATTCLQAENIYVPKEVARLHDEVNTKTFIGNKIEKIISSKINKSVCGSQQTIVLDPNVTDETPQKKTEIYYNFKESEIVDFSNIIEIK